MNCYDQCRKFFYTKKPEDLGDITQENTCAYCLYWENGPGRPIYEYNNCECNQLFTQLSNLGTTFDVESYEKVKKCLKSGKNCGVMYSNFTNTEDPFITRKKTVNVTCDNRKIWSKSFKYQGVL
jgi:hypothetical protein